MNILLDAFYDLNFGDDIFIETITGIFPGYKFYSFMEYYPSDVITWASKIPNLYLLPECDVFLEKNMFDAYICIGGNVFWDKLDYTKRKKRVESVKQVHGPIIYWGFNLYNSYSEQTQKDIVDLMKDADIIAPRDNKSADFLNRLLPGKKVNAMADFAFMSDWKKKSTCSFNGTLGISVRRPEYAEDHDMDQYTSKLQEVINVYLEGDNNRSVTLFSLSHGTISDKEVAEEILSGVTERGRVKHVIYTGDTGSIKEEIAGCDLMICTRLHAMISCIAMNVPFIPIIYDVKMENILNELGYQRNKIYFRNMEGILTQLTEFLNEPGNTNRWTLIPEKGYIQRTVVMKEQMQMLLRGNNGREKITKEDMTNPVCETKIHLLKYSNHREKDVATLEAALNQREKDVATLEAALNQRKTDVAMLVAAPENSSLPAKLKRFTKSVFLRR